jgi:PrtD family type I secretion system ABC transporter
LATARPSKNALTEALGACRRGFFVVAVFSLGVNLCMLTTPIYMMQLFDRVLSSRSTETLIALLIVAIAALAVLALLDILRTNVLIRVSTWLDRRLGGSLLGASVSRALADSRGGSAQVLRDLSTLRSFLSGSGVFPLMDAPWAPIFLAVMFLLHPLLGWLSLIGALILFAIAILNETVTRNILADANNAYARAMRRAEAAIRNADVINGMGMLPNIAARWQGENAHSLDRQARASNLSGTLTALSKFIRFGLQIGVLSLGAWLSLEGELSPGAMIAGSIIMGRALAPVEQAIGAWKGFVGARAAYQRIREMLEGGTRDPGMPLPPPEGRLNVEGLTYAHRPGQEPALRNVSFELKAGESLAIIGPTASGKTTLARLLIGNLPPSAGVARLDGMDVAAWDADDLGQYVGYLPQAIELFDGTIRENIARMGEADPQAVILAARLAQVHDLILGLPDGYDTEIGDGGAGLSGGQRQRIGLARALYGTPRFVVLDEPNSNLDTDGEEALLKAMAALKKEGITVVLISHRPNLLRFVDRVLVLNKGRVHLFGSRDEILQKMTGKPAAPKAEAVATAKPSVRIAGKQEQGDG